MESRCRSTLVITESHMGDGYNFRQLRERILALSAAQDWETARKEWALLSVHESDEHETSVPCLLL